VAALLSVQEQSRKKTSGEGATVEFSGSTWLAWWRRGKRQEVHPLYRWTSKWSSITRLARHHGMTTAELAHGRMGDVLGTARRASATF
jgi:hypothetical protein